MTRPALIVLAKAPSPGRVKTRLCPPLTHEQAATLARASLEDTLEAGLAVAAGRHILALAGRPGPWLPSGYTLVDQCGGGLGARLAGAFAAAAGPALLVGMDTPQLTVGRLDRALGALERAGTDAVLGPAPDGGYWAIGLRVPDARVFEGVPMSASDTCAVQRSRLAELDLRWSEVEELRDFDTLEGALTVADEAPGTRFAEALGAMVSSRRSVHAPDREQAMAQAHS